MSSGFSTVNKERIAEHPKMAHTFSVKALNWNMNFITIFPMNQMISMTLLCFLGGSLRATWIMGCFFLLNNILVNVFEVSHSNVDIYGMQIVY